jgi:hypothetical protein
MLKAESHGFGGEEAGEKSGAGDLPAATNEWALSTAGVLDPTDPIAAMWAGDVSCAGLRCWWHGGAAELEPSAAHDATHCAALKIKATISKATK